MRLVKGEAISVENLMYGVLVASANDAALVLAQNYPGGEQGFLAAMNNKAKELNLNDTYFANPTGLDSDEWGNLLPARSYTTALDLARLASWAMRNEVLAKMVATPQITVSDTSGKRQHQLYTINELLGYLPGIKGIKTGWTEEAGECLVSYTEREGRGIITVVLGSGNRFGETASLVDWAFSNHQWQKITPSI
jgi:D-alanyl-D-alanine carboxypeptidase (penicillin-binding protein 5/6)